MRKERDSTISTPIAKPVVLVFMGVSGCGTTKVAAFLAGRLGWRSRRAMQCHPQPNIEKMEAGHPLTDDDRAPWLEKVARWVEERLDARENGLITFSALKRSYRDVINWRRSGVRVRVSGGFKEDHKPRGLPLATVTSCRRAYLTVSSPTSRNPPRMSR
jgi:gluconokinase/shikimate kinase